MVHPLASEKIWFDKAKVEEAESNYYARKYSGASAVTPASSALLADIKKIKDHIRNALGADSSYSSDCDIDMDRLEKLEKESEAIRNLIVRLEYRIATLEGDTTYLDDEIDMQRLEKLENENETLRNLINRLESRVAKLEVGGAPAPAPAKAAPAVEEDDDDDDVDLFGSDDDEEAEKIKQERLDAYAAKKAKKPTLIAKSNIILDVKPWDDETDMAALEASVRTIKMDGLLWGTGKLVAVGYGIKKLQISCVVEDDKVGTDDLEEKITAFEDLVQSVDIAAFNKI